MKRCDCGQGEHDVPIFEYKLHPKIDILIDATGLIFFTDKEGNQLGEIPDDLAIGWEFWSGLSSLIAGLNKANYSLKAKGAKVCADNFHLSSQLSKQKTTYAGNSNTKKAFLAGVLLGKKQGA